jgi:catechol 2,3-dioxygenase-like lactoylglutathione lyase family enzyme
VNEDLRLASVLETVLYYPSEQQDEMKRFYEDVLGLESLGLGRWSLAFRLGQGVVLLFDRERSSTQEEPPPHGASGSIHAAFLAAPDEYEAWKERLADRGVTLIDEIAWDSGVRSCYFNDPAATCSRSQSAISGPGRRRQVRRKQPLGRTPARSLLSYFRQRTTATRLHASRTERPLAAGRLNGTLAPVFGSDQTRSGVRSDIHLWWVGSLRLDHPRMRRGSLRDGFTHPTVVLQMTRQLVAASPDFTP